jgi:transcriptional regulator with GAF, ATPase, and Fis domain
VSTLLAIRGPLTGMRLELGPLTTLGRAETVDLVLPDTVVSREHARIEQHGLGWLIRDLGSRHGTFLNGERLGRDARPLLRNDHLQIGQSLFLFDSDFDIQNADFTDSSVYFAAPNDDTVEVAPVAVLDSSTVPADERDEKQLDFVVQLSELFTSTRVPFADALRSTCTRIASMFSADSTLLLLWDSAARKLRPSVALSAAGEKFLADSTIIARAAHDRKSVLVCDRPRLAAIPDPEAPPPPLVRSVICAPIVSDDVLMGMLYLQRDELDAYSLIDLRNAQAVARLMAVFIELRQQTEALALRVRFAASSGDGGGLVTGRSKVMSNLMDLLARVAPTPATVLITGETGTGKEMIAREVHRQSPAGKAGAPFVSVNCSALPETLFESLVFGHEKGAFTGAVRLQQGLIEQANGGTLFLDEIGELSLAMQPKLLRFLQERVFTRVGGMHLIRANVRLICATNRDLEVEVRAGRFREDLYHRISVLPLHLPPLRERREDIAPLAEHLVHLHARALSRPVMGITEEGIRLLEKQLWPGNIRELSNCIERAVLLCDGKALLPRHFTFLGQPGIPQTPVDENATPTARSLADVEKSHIARILDMFDGNQIRAADVLGIHRNTLRKKIQEYGLRVGG